MSTSDVYITIYWCSLDHLYTWYCCRSQHAVMRCCARICIRSTHPTQGHVLYHTGTDYTAPTGQHELRGRSYRSGPLSSLKYLDHHMEIHCGTKLAGKISPPPCATYYIYIYMYFEVGTASSPSHLLSSPFFPLSLLVVTQIRGHILTAGSSPSLPTTVRASQFLSREDFSSFFPRRLASNCAQQ